jgi:dolichol-phosphate mannosyltransferase
MNRRSSRRPSVAVVLPLLNESEILRSLLCDIRKSFSQFPCDWSVYFVNDGSTDASAEILDGFALEDKRVKVLHLSRNFGHTAAVRAGLDYVNADAVILMDCDGQDDPNAIPQFLASWQNGADVVYAVRIARKESFWKRMLFSGFYQLLSRVSSVPIPRDAGNFGLLDRRVVEQIRALPEGDRYLPGLRSWVGFHQAAVTVERLARHDGNPRVRIRGLISLAKTALFGFSRVPLHVFYVLAMLSAAVSVGTIAFASYHRIFTGLAIPGWASVTIVSSFFGAINSLGIAILGEYVARIYDQVRGRPSYIVARFQNTETTTDDSVEACSEAELLHELVSVSAIATPATRTRPSSISVASR